MVSAGLIAPLLGETGAHTRDSLVRVAVGIGDVEVWQLAFWNFLSLVPFLNASGRVKHTSRVSERMLLLQASHVREVIHSPSVVRL